MAKRKKRAPAPGGVVREERVELRMSTKEKSAFQEAADRQGIGLSQWLRLAATMMVRDHGGKVELVELG